MTNGIGLTSAATILAEMGDYRDFASADKMAMYFGIVPSVYQSAGEASDRENHKERLEAHAKDSGRSC